MGSNFTFIGEYEGEVKRALAKYPEDRKQSAVLPLLDLAQRQIGGYVSDEAIDEISTMLEMPRIRVIEVATFYTMINLKPVGKFLLQCCTTTPCWLRDSSAVVDAIKEHLGIGMGETTDDGVFSLMEVECVGACVNAPVVQINDDLYEDLTPENVIDVLEELRAGRQPTIGSQVGRTSSEPIEGRTTLIEAMK
ncbi:MAG: NADH-quinone oxidoreductase subunit NuoE [Pseudomonadota bacterium]|nr:NADH-quinone oxidoreductase subunit NuoE [Pseudomonadota bacterium]